MAGAQPASTDTRSMLKGLGITGGGETWHCRRSHWESLLGVGSITPTGTAHAGRRLRHGRVY
jgi:hypothetical protein